MYQFSYGDREKAMELFRTLPSDTKEAIFHTDFSKAERICPQKMKIGKVLKTAISGLA
jgi:hypothetical protein